MPDLAAWTTALFTGRLLSPASTALVARPGFDQGDGIGESPGWVTADASVYGEPLLTTAGGGGDVGHDVVVAWLPERGQAVAIASNTPEITAEQLLDAIGPALLAGDPLPEPVVVGDVDPAAAGDVVGTYELPTGGAFDVRIDADRRRLVVAARGADAVAALLPVPEDDATAADVRRHEQAVLDLLGGTSRQGREERAAVEHAAGPIDDLTLAGTVLDGGELHTYVTVTSGDDRTLVWYSVDDEGGVSAAEIATDPPTLALGLDPSPERGTEPATSFRPDDPTGKGPDVTVTFTDHTITVTAPSGTVTARPAS
jgi:hypothetical protein